MIAEHCTGSRANNNTDSYSPALNDPGRLHSFSAHQGLSDLQTWGSTGLCLDEQGTSWTRLVLYHVILRYIMLYHVISCYVTLYHIG